MLDRRSAPRRAGRGFTLLELIIVLVVLVALAALVVPTLGFLRTQAGHATASAGAAEVLSNLEVYRASIGTYPERLDSLVTTTGTVYNRVWADGGATGFGVGRLSTPQEAATISYYLRNSGAFGSTVLQHSPAASDPNLSTATSPLYSLGGTEEVAGPDIPNPDYDPNDPDSPEFIPGPPVTQSADRFCIVDPTAPMWASVARVIRAAYPNQTNPASPTIPPGRFLVAMGVGERSSCVGSTMASAPLWGGTPKNTYGRYIAFFDVSPGASFRGNVQLKLVTDSTFNTIARSTELYQKSGPQDNQGL